MGTARAVVVGSTSCPACSARVSNPYSRIFWSAMSVTVVLLSFQKRLYRRPEFVPVLQEGIVPAQGLDLRVARPHAGATRPLGRRPHLARREEPVARDADEQDVGLDAGERLPF